MGINDLITLPHRVDTDHWDCFHGKVRNLLVVLGQNNRIEGELSAFTRCGDVGL